MCDGACVRANVCAHAKPENKTIAGKHKCEETLMSWWTTQNAYTHYTHIEMKVFMPLFALQPLLFLRRSSIAWVYLTCPFTASIGRGIKQVHTQTVKRGDECVWVKLKATSIWRRTNTKKYDLFLAFCCNHLRVLAKTIFLVFSFFSAFVFFLSLCFRKSAISVLPTAIIIKLNPKIKIAIVLVFLISHRCIRLLSRAQHFRSLCDRRSPIGADRI